MNESVAHLEGPVARTPCGVSSRLSRIKRTCFRRREEHRFPALIRDSPGTLMVEESMRPEALTANRPRSSHQPRAQVRDSGAADRDFGPVAQLELVTAAGMYEQSSGEVQVDDVRPMDPNERGRENGLQVRQGF